MRNPLQPLVQTVPVPLWLLRLSLSMLSPRLSTDSEVTFANTDDHDTDSTSKSSYYPLTPNVATPEETSSEFEQYTPSHTPSGK